MKHNYLKILTLAFFTAGFSLHTLAQTYVTVWSDDFENYRNDISLTTVGYEVWEGTGKSVIRAGEGHNGSNGYAKSDNSKTGFTLLRSIFPLEVGATYRASVSTTYTSGVNHNPLNIRKLNASGTDQGSSYFNNGVAAGTGAWQDWSTEFIIEAGAEGVRLQQYRFGAIHTLLVDDIKLEISGGIEWSGSTSNDWNTAANWFGGVVPTSNDHVLIPDVTNQPLINSNVTVTSLEVATGASLTVSGASTLTVSGQLTGTGLGFVEIMSGASLIADRIQGSNHVIHRQTRFTGGQYSIVGSPVQIARVSDLGALVYGYDETVAYNSTVDNAGSGNNGLDRFIEMATSTDTLAVGKGYFSAYTDEMVFTGYPNNGDISRALTLTDHDATNALDENNFEGFNLVSNPYASAIDYDVLIAVNGTAGTNVIEESIWLWDDNGSNTTRGSNSDYVTINNLGAVGTESTAASALWDGNIRSGQGFFVKAKTAAALTFNNTMQVTGNNTDGGFYRKTSNAEYQTLKLNVTGNDLYNETLIGFAEGSVLGIDRLDAQKIDTKGSLKLYTLVENKALAIQALPKDLDEVEIKLGMSVEAAGTYQLALGELTNWSNEYTIILHDDLLGKSTVLDSKNANYSFIAESGVSKRFRVTLSKAILRADLLASDFEVNASLDGLKISSNELKGQSMEVTISDITGRKLLATQLNHVGAVSKVAYSFSQNKIYIIAVKSSGNTSISKILIK